jgi:hypothetical protein
MPAPETERRLGDTFIGNITATWRTSAALAGRQAEDVHRLLDFLRESPADAAAAKNALPAIRSLRQHLKAFDFALSELNEFLEE